MANDQQPWHRGISAYQWFVLAVASAGWVFDIYEGQVFNITRVQLLAELLDEPRDGPAARFYGEVILGIFLVGGALGGILFGALADRWGRVPTLNATILMYSIFSGLTYFAESLWQVAVLRFLVAIGTGGEWSVGAAIVAEVFPPRARAHAGGIFHASSILGTWLAALAGLAVGTQWRYAYLIGVLPAILILLVRARMREPDVWKQRQTDDRANPTGGARSGRVIDLLADPRWRTRAILGLLFAATGLGTFWAVTVAGQDLARRLLLAEGASPDVARSESQFAYGIVQTTGGGLGLLAFGPLAMRWGRRRAFIAFQLATLAVVPITCYLPTTYHGLLALLPLYGFFTLGIHAGFAIYFPEMFPTRLRATAAGFCFNGGRLAAAPMMYISAHVKAMPNMDLRLAITLLSGLALVGIVLVWLLPETKDQQLPE